MRGCWLQSMVVTLIKTLHEQQWHNIIQIHNNVLWDWQYYAEYFSHSYWMWGIFVKYCQSHIILLWIWKMLILSNKISFDVYVEMAFVLTLIVHFNYWTFFNFLRNSLHICGQNMGQITYSKCKVSSLYIVVCTICHENLWSWSTRELFPSSGSHKHYAHFLVEFDWSKVLFLGIKYAIFVCICYFKCLRS